MDKKVRDFASGDAVFVRAKVDRANSDGQLLVLVDGVASWVASEFVEFAPSNAQPDDEALWDGVDPNDGDPIRIVRRRGKLVAQSRSTTIGDDYRDSNDGYSLTIFQIYAEATLRGPK